MNKFDLDSFISYAKEIKILYIEEDEKQREEALSVFGIFFNNIDIAIDGIEAYEYFKKDKYDLIITGIDIPKINGIELIDKIRAINEHITILVISSSDEKKHFLDLIKLGIDGYILKPIEIEQFITVLQKTIEKLYNKDQLEQYKVSLEKKVKEEVEKRVYTEKAMAYKSKLASMGEIIDVIAHQWKQPINIMSIYVDFLQYQYQDGDLNLKTIKDFQKNFDDQKKHILETLKEFRDFFRPNKEKETFLINNCIKSVLLLTKDEFYKNKINIEVDIKDDFEIYAFENEFKHIILNIINNAKDEYSKKPEKKKFIKVTTFLEEEKKYIMIDDNAGGIPPNIIEDIFKPNITTKTEIEGTGMGLYLSQQIVEKAGGKIIASNIDNGARFTIELN